MLKMTFHILLVAAFFIAAAGCKNEQSADKTNNPESALYKKGKVVYIGRCIACHSPDPKKDGPLGPAVWGVSKELLEARVLRAEYPAGYTPKRNTKLMQAMPELAPDIDALHEFLSK